MPLAVRGCSGPDWPFQDQTKFQRARSLDSEGLIEHVKSSNSVSMFGGTRAGDVVRGREWYEWGTDRMIGETCSSSSHDRDSSQDLLPR